MKKFLMLLCMTLFLAACGNSVEKNNSKSSKKDEEVAVSGQTDTDTKEDEVEESEVLKIQLEEKIIIEDIGEFSLKKNGFTRKVYPSNPGEDPVYFHLKDSEQILLNTVISLKNLSISKKVANEFISDYKYIYDNKYEYVPEVTIEKDGGSNFDIKLETIIEPLQTGVFHFTGFLPSELEHDNKPLKFIFTVGENEYEFIIR